VHIFQEKFNFFSVIHFIIFEFILQAIYFTWTMKIFYFKFDGFTLK
jgi:hypothetical protein